MQYDLIIIGSGSVGAAAGYYARRAGLNVLMTDAHQPPHQEGSHHGSSRLIRHAYGEGEKYVPLVLRAQQLWDELAEISGEAVFERTGVINLGPASSAFLANVAASARAFQLEVEELDAQAVMQRWPEIRLPDDYRAIFEPASGVLRSELAVETWIRLAREAGCAQLFNCPVSAIHHHADGITIDTLDGEYHGKKLLVSAGTWSPACFRTSLSSRYARCSPGTRPMAVTAARITSRPSPASCPTAINITVSRRKIMN